MGSKSEWANGRPTSLSARRNDPAAAGTNLRHLSIPNRYAGAIRTWRSTPTLPPATLRVAMRAGHHSAGRIRGRGRRRGRERERSALWGRGHYVDMFPGLKPRAESYSPFGTDPTDFAENADGRRSTPIY